MDPEDGWLLWGFRRDPEAFRLHVVQVLLASRVQVPSSVSRLAAGGTRDLSYPRCLIPDVLSRSTLGPPCFCQFCRS